MIRVHRYRHGVKGADHLSPDEAARVVEEGADLVWIDVERPDEDDLAQLRTELGLEQVTIEALRRERHRSRISRIGHVFHFTLRDVDCPHGHGLAVREIDVVLCENWIITARHPDDDGNVFGIGQTEHDFELQRSEGERAEVGILLWALVDDVIDRYYRLGDEVDERLDEIEEIVFTPDRPTEVPREVFTIRRDLMQLRRAAAPMRDVINAIIRREVPAVSDHAVQHFQSSYDRQLRLLDLIESQRELLTGLLEADLGVISNRMNEVMKKMTSWGAILIVATLIAGIYGMNFQEMPELRWAYGYPAALGFMGLSTGILYWVFKRHDWL